MPIANSAFSVCPVNVTSGSDSLLALAPCREGKHGGVMSSYMTWPSWHCSGNLDTGGVHLLAHAIRLPVKVPYVEVWRVGVRGNDCRVLGHLPDLVYLRGRMGGLGVGG